MEIFETSSIAGMVLKNRVIRSATHEGLGDDRGYPRDELKDLYIRLARGGVGAIITGYAGVRMDGRAWPNMMLIENDECIPAYQKLTSAVKPYGTPLILQIAHGGGLSDPAVTGSAPKAPTGLRYKNGKCTARELGENDIEEIIESFVSAVERAKLAGFDGVEIHAAHGYLLSSFLSPHLNRRADKWGGTLENRFRIIREIIGRAREKVGKFPILIKFSAHDSQKNGMNAEESARLAQYIQEASFDAIEVSCGNDDYFYTIRTPKVPVDAILNFDQGLRKASKMQRRMASFIIPHLYKTYPKMENYNVAVAEKIKANVDIPVIVVGGVRKLGSMREIIGQGKADYVSMCRPLIIEPNLVDKMKNGKQEESRCINCNYCIIGVISEPLRCYYGKINKNKV